MTQHLYIGLRIEVPIKFVGRNFLKRFNSGQKNIQVLDLHKEGKISAEKKEHMLIAHGVNAEKGSTGMSNFSIMIDVGTDEDVKRLIKIINVLGNDRLIRERINTFMIKKSMLNDIPQFEVLKEAFEKFDKISPGFIRAGWYYAPEALIL